MDILNYLHSKSITITLDNVVVGALLVVFIILLIFAICKCLRVILGKKFKVVNLNISIANIGNISIEKNKDVSRIAHKAWVEVMTRKVGLLFEEDKDVIVEVYNSWYSLFGIIRELLKEIEPKKKDEDLEKLENVLIKVLNSGLRPHLTKWQAKYRRWYDQAIKNEDNKGLSPQEVQKKYKKYDELVIDLKETNQKMLQFADELKKLI